MKNFNGLLSFSLASALLVPSVGFSAKKDPKKADAPKKNVIFIITDDMRLDMTGFGGSKGSTPNLDALRDQSVEFANACTTTGLSSPSRAALFTGRYGHRTGLDDNLHLWHSRLMTLDPEQSTIYEWARDKGYYTGYVGKWHVGYITPDMRGVEYYVGDPVDKRLSKPARPNFEGVQRYYEQGETFDEKPEYYSTSKLTYEKSEPKRQVNNSILFLEKVKNDPRPFFLTVSFHTPHPAYTVPAPWNKMYDYTKIELPASMGEQKEGLQYQHDVMWHWMDLGHMSKEDWQKTIAYSMGLMTMFDQAIGELFDAIKKNGLWDDTMIIFTSDQGSMLADHALYDKGPYAYDELMRIPMLVKMPGVEPKKVEHHVSLIDLNQTMVEYMGLQPTQANVDSRSLIPLIKGGDAAWANVPDEAFYRYEWYNGRWFGVRAIRTPEYKYSFNPSGADELYDLKKDPNEMVNRIDDPAYADAVKQMRSRLLAHLAQCGDNKVRDLMVMYTGQQE